MSRAKFRTRLFVILSLFALVPSVVLTIVWAATVREALPFVSGTAPWERVAETGARAVAAARQSPLAPAQRAAVDAHEQELRSSLEQATRFRYLAPRTMRVFGAVGIATLVLLTVVASRVAGHLSRQLSRPLDELVGWTDRIAHGDPLPAGPPRRGAPEFEMLRQRMRKMATDLETGRARALEAERLRAFRESARQVAHELKNALTPIRFAIERLRREPPAELVDTIDVLATESARLESMAKSFAQFGRLPEGPASDVDLGELTRTTARAVVPPDVLTGVDVEEDLPLIRGHHDALARALSNVLLNAVDACANGGRVAVHVGRGSHDPVRNGRETVRIAVRDSGCGVDAEKLEHMWDPYVTHKAGGTGLGLAIARQTIAAHDGWVGATSVPGEGTEVALTLPVRPTLDSDGGDGGR